MHVDTGAWTRPRYLNGHVFGIVCNGNRNIKHRCLSRYSPDETQPLVRFCNVKSTFSGHRRKGNGARDDRLATMVYARDNSARFLSAEESAARRTITVQMPKSLMPRAYAGTCNSPIRNRSCTSDTRSNRFIERPCRRRVTEVNWNESALGCFAAKRIERVLPARQYDPRTLVRRKSNRKKAHPRKARGEGRGGEEEMLNDC